MPQNVYRGRGRGLNTNRTQSNINKMIKFAKYIVQDSSRNYEERFSNIIRDEVLRLVLE